MLNTLKNILRNSIFYSIYKRLEALIASKYYWNPSKKMIVIWVTWTDWKSTTCNLIHYLINRKLGKCALVSTINLKIWDNQQPNNTKLTALPPFQLQKFLQEAVNSWCEYAVIEVSSHWLAQHRVDWIDFDVAVLTNITEEHLDYHNSIDEYAKTKKQLFYKVIRNINWKGFAVLNKDDVYWKEWDEEMPFDKIETYSIQIPASIRWKEIKEFKDHTEFIVNYLSENIPAKINLLWTFNVYNVLAALATWKLLGIDLKEWVKTIQDFKWLPGRLEVIKDKKWTTYFIDFAHTPAALENVLRFLSSVKWNWKIITVFGAPWNRDKTKRPVMWRKVNTFSDYIIVTDDDPDTEDRLSIIKDIIKWIDRKYWDRFWIQPERELAIQLAVEIAWKDDIVLIAWKWHEQVQLTNFGKRKYSDKETLLNLIEQ